jgi:hypothetical protein
MEIITELDVSIRVSVERTIEIDKSYSISPSYGYAGITAGVVTVYTMGYTDSIWEGTDDNGVDVTSLIKSYTDAELSVYTSPELEEHGKYLRDTIWVVYYYPNNPVEQGEYYAFPLREFVDHTSQL